MTIQALPKAVFYSVAISKQLLLTYVVSISLSHNHGNRPCQLCIQSQFRVSTSLVPRAMTVVFGPGTRLRMRMRTRLANGVLHNGQQLGSAVNNFFDQDKFEAMKTLSGCEARAVISISFVLKSR